METRLTSGSDLGWMSGTRSSLRNAVIGVPADPPANSGASESGDQGGTELSTRVATEMTYRLHPVTNSNTFSGNIRSELAELEAGREVVGGPSSFHVGGAHFLMGDGSVRFISQNIDPKTFRNLAHRSDGEMLKDF
jgi:prepilin-type processing-associated H-X9-DG protein